MGGHQRGRLGGCRVVCAGAFKGGVGKSTVVLHLAAFSASRGESVCLVDADPQRSALRVAEECIGNVAVETADTRDDLMDGVPALAERFDRVYVDLPAGSGELLFAALARADACIVPSGAGLLDLRALQRTLHVVEQVRSVRENGKPEAVVVWSRVIPRTKLFREAEAAATELGFPVADTVLQQRTPVADAFGQRRMVWDLGGHAADEFRNLCLEMLGDGEASARERDGRPGERGAAADRRGEGEAREFAAEEG